MREIIKFIGPPGTGKTYHLLEEVEDACNHYIPKDIGVVSFTVAAIQEAKNRIVRALEVPYRDISNVATIHSHCFRLLCLKKEDVMESTKNIREFNEIYPAYQISCGGNNGDDQKEFRGNDKIFNEIQLLRCRMIPKSIWPQECQDMAGAWFEYMENEGKVDFTGMIEQCIYRELSPSIKILMIDEAQDLNKLEHTIVSQWGQYCDQVQYYGDSSQAIFRFAGADPSLFINIKTDKVVSLDQSYRLSPAVLDKSLEIINQAHVKEIVDFKSTNKWGPGRILNVKEPDLTLSGTHMILCRCNFQLNKYITALRKQNIPFCNQHRKEEKVWNPLDSDGAESIKIYLRMIKGEELTIYEILQMAKNCIVKTTMKRGTKTKLKKMPLNKKKTYPLYMLVHFGFFEDFVNGNIEISNCFKVNSQSADLIFHLAKNDPCKLSEIPDVCVGTIHSVKGGSARHVWIDTGITTKIKKSLFSDHDAWDDEVRTAYVACTRAEETLGFIRGGGYQNPFLI